MKNNYNAASINISDFSEIFESYGIDVLGIEAGDLVINIQVPKGKEAMLSIPEKETLSETLRSFGEITPDWSGWIGRRKKFESAEAAEYINWALGCAAGDIFEKECALS